MTTATKRPRRDHVLALGLLVYRTARGGTQEQEAALTGVSWRTWLRWERRTARAPLAKLEAVAARWGVPVDALTTEPAHGPDAQLRKLVAEHGVEPVRVAAARVIPAL